MADNDSFIGKYMGNYRLVTRLDSGSYGSVYTGKHRIFTDDPAVAIKILHAHLNSSYEHDKFIQEAQLLKKLNHSHILPIRDAGIGRKPFMVEGVQIEAVQYQHAKVTPVAPTQLNPHLPMHIE